MFYSLQSKLDVANYSCSLRNLALELIKIANDIRLMASGPVAGFAEIFIPPVHPGSSIMPGKVNPSLAECLTMICFDMIGNDVSVAMAVFKQANWNLTLCCLECLNAFWIQWIC